MGDHCFASKLSKNGRCLHFFAHSAENACYSSTIRPTLSTLFLKSPFSGCPAVASFLPDPARFYSYYYIFFIDKGRIFPQKIFCDKARESPLFLTAFKNCRRVCRQICIGRLIAGCAPAKGLHAPKKRRFLQSFLHYYIYNIFRAPIVAAGGDFPFRIAAALAAVRCF